MKAEPLILCGVTVAVAYRIIKWIKNAKRTPDPWGSEVEQLIQNPDIEPLCHRCFTPHSHQTWFCPECGASVGDYNNYMPYIHVFAEGEVFRSGVNDHVRPSVLTMAGYFLLSLSSYAILAPVYWFFLVRNFVRHAPASESKTSALPAQ